MLLLYFTGIQLRTSVVVDVGKMPVLPCIFAALLPNV